MSKQMTKKQIVDLITTFTLISVSKNAEQELQNSAITEERVDKMMRVCMNLFNNDEKKAEDYIRNRMISLFEKLDEHDDSECQIKN